MRKKMLCALGIMMLVLCCGGAGAARAEEAAAEEVKADAEEATEVVEEAAEEADVSGEIPESSSEGLLSRPSNYQENEADMEGRLDNYVEENASQVNGNDVMQYIYNALRDNFGFNHAAACAVLANARHESNFNYTVVGDGGTSYGIFQWHAGRWSSLKAWCTENGYDWQNADGQIAYLRYELTTGYKDTLDYLLEVEDSDVGAFDGAYYMCVHFEKPRDTYGQANSRGKEAIEIFGMEALRDGYRSEILSDDDSRSMWDLSNY